MAVATSALPQRPAKSWALTQLGQNTSLWLTIDGVDYDITQFTCSYAVNEIPTAQCLLAVGRDVSTLRKANIHSTAASLRQMRKCTVTFHPVGEYRPDGTLWPADPFVIFDGFFMGLAYTKINGKVQVIANLKHWLLDLACSSCLTKNSHPLNPAQWTARAVSIAIGGEVDSGAATSIYVGALVGQSVVRDHCRQDFWSAIKRLFCGLTNIPTQIGQGELPGVRCGGTGNAVINDRAKHALLRMEGPADLYFYENTATGVVRRYRGCSKPYVYGVPLPLDLLSVPNAEDAVATAVVEQLTTSYASTTFWDKLINEFCASFNMAVVPCADFALVIADTPAYRGNEAGELWKEILPDEYDSFQAQADLDHPLRAIGVVVQVMSDMGAPTSTNNNQVPGQPEPPNYLPAVGGCFTAELDEPDDGIIRFVPAPAWLQSLIAYEPYVGSTTGIVSVDPSRTETQPNATGGPLLVQTSQVAPNAALLLNQYAQAVYVATFLRGRQGFLGGKLRFDIAPGSVIRIAASEDKILQGEDDLAVDIVASVSRVTIAINAESSVAGTTYALSHIRTSGENVEDRTSVAAHPLFKNAIHGGGKCGAPLVAGHELL